MYLSSRKLRVNRDHEKGGSNGHSNVPEAPKQERQDLKAGYSTTSCSWRALLEPGQAGGGQGVEPAILYRTFVLKSRG